MEKTENNQLRGQECESREDKDETLEITDKFFKKITDTFNKTGYADGVVDGQNSIFQESFDKGFEDGFRNGFLMGKLKATETDTNSRPERGNCQICIDSNLLEKPESELQKRHLQVFQDMQEKSQN